MPGSALAAAFSMAYQKQRVITADTTVTVGDANGVFLVDSTAGPIIITVLPAADLLSGRYFHFIAMNGATNPVTVAFSAGDSYNDGDTADLVLSEDGSSTSVYRRTAGGGWFVPLAFPVGIDQRNLLIRAASQESFYEDDPGALGNHTQAESFPPVSLGLASMLKLFSAAVRIDFPAAVGESASIQFFRFRKTSPFGVFSVSNASSITVIDSTSPWSWTIDITASLAGLDFNPLTDSLAISNVYVAGGAPTMRALRVDFQFEASDVLVSSAHIPADILPGGLWTPP